MAYLWDPDKAAANKVKHGIDFADTVAVFEDDLYLALFENSGFAGAESAVFKATAVNACGSKMFVSMAKIAL